MIVGITRFSVLSSKGWVLSRSSDPETFLFSPRRLSAHFGLFEALTLPCMKSESSVFLILISTLLPEIWRQRLAEGIFSSDHIHVREVAPDMNMGDVVKKFLAELHAKTPEDKSIITYRFDDDDGLAVGRTQALHKHRKCGAKIITYRNGLYICWDGSLKIAEVEYESNAQGIAFISNNAQKHISLFGGHTKLTQKHDSLVLKERGAWLRTIHSASDSFRDRSVTWQPLEGEILALFNDRFPYVQLARLEAALAAASTMAPIHAFKSASANSTLNPTSSSASSAWTKLLKMLSSKSSA